MSRLVSTIISFCLFLGASDALIQVTLKMAGLAAYAHQHDQLSYAKFTRAMTSSAPKSSPSPVPDQHESR